MNRLPLGAKALSWICRSHVYQSGCFARPEALRASTYYGIIAPAVINSLISGLKQSINVYRSLQLLTDVLQLYRLFG
jgi:hypothetical protein